MSHEQKTTMNLEISHRIELLKLALNLNTQGSETPASNVNFWSHVKEDFEHLESLILNNDSTLTYMPKPAVPVEDSVTKDFIICLEDGRQMKMLKRHLKTTYNMTPQEYRKKWNLPVDYPMVAESYTKKRSDLAQKIGLGKHDR